MIRHHHVLLLALAAAVPHAACGFDAGPDALADGDPVVAADPTEAERYDASPETLAATGISAWYRLPPGADPALVTEGRDAGNQLIAAVKISADRIEVVGASPVTLATSDEPALVAAFANNPVLHAYEQDSATRAAPELLAADDGLDDAGITARLTPGVRAQKKNLIKCFVAASAAAYDAHPGNVCGFTFQPGESTTNTKIWTRTVTSHLGLVHTTSILVAFKGTSITSIRDIWADVSSQKLTPKFNPLGGYEYPMPSRVGAGFQGRWRVEEAQHAHALRQRLAAAAALARRPGLGALTPVEVIVTGHSLGAAVATLAGYDVATYLRDLGVARSRTTTYIYAYNPPRTGNAAWPGDFQNAMHDARGLNLVMREFTRDADGVQGVPLAQQHPVWFTGRGAHGSFTYCPQFNAPAVAPLPRFLPWPLNYWAVLLKNHTPVTRWDHDVDANLADDHVDCMFERRP